MLIWIIPQGTVAFVSNAWGGHASDKCITKKCGILKVLLPGEVVLADQGFNIAESVRVMQAKLHIATSLHKRQESTICSIRS